MKMQSMTNGGKKTFPKENVAMHSLKGDYILK